MSIDEQRLSVTAASPPKVEETHQAHWYTRLLSPLWLCLLIALILRVWLIAHTHGMIDGDEALVGIQAEHILQGEFPVYFYGIPYFGSLEAYLVSIFIALFGPSTWALRAEATAVSLVLVWLTWRFASALADTAHLPLHAKKCFTVVSALVAAVPPLYIGIVELRTWGGYIETFVLILLLLLSTLRLTQRWRVGAPKRELLWRWAGIGFIVGLGLWVDPLIISAIVAAAIWIVVDRIIEFVNIRRALPNGEGHIITPLTRSLQPLRSIWAAIVTSIIGLTPAIVWGAGNHWANVKYIQKLGGTWSIQRIHVVHRVTNMFVSCIAPRMIGGGLPVESKFLMALHSPLLLFGTFCIFTTTALVVISFFWHRPVLISMRSLAALPALFAACAAVIYCTGSASAYSLISCGLDLAGRYATPLMLAYPFFVATIFTLAIIYLHEKPERRLKGINDTRALSTTEGQGERGQGERNKSRPYRWIAQIALFALLIVYLGTQAGTYGLSDANYDFQSPYCSHAPANYDPIIAYMQQRHIHYAWATNLLAHPFTFKTNGQIIVVDPLELMNPPLAVNRIPAYSQAVYHADRASFIVYIQHGDPYPLILRLLNADGATYQVARFPSEPNIDVMVVTPLNRTVSPVNTRYIQAFNCFTT